MIKKILILICWCIVSIEYVDSAPKPFVQEEKDHFENLGNGSLDRQSLSQEVYYPFRLSGSDLMILDVIMINDILRARAIIAGAGQRRLRDDDGQVAPHTSPARSEREGSQSVVELERERELFL